MKNRQRSVRVRTYQDFVEIRIGASYLAKGKKAFVRLIDEIYKNSRILDNFYRGKEE